MYFLVDKNIVTKGLQKPNPVFALGTIAQYLLIQCVQGLYRTKLPQTMRIHCDNIRTMKIWKNMYLVRGGVPACRGTGKE